MSEGNARRKRRSAVEWRQLIEAWRRSGLSQPVFCREHDVAVSTLQYWRRRLRDEQVPAMPASAGVIDLGALGSHVDADNEASYGWSFELLLGDWLRVSLRRA